VGGLGRLLELGDTVSAEQAQAAIEAEIDREQCLMKPPLNQAPSSICCASL
jgi:hypothetical protein